MVSKRTITGLSPLAEQAVSERMMLVASVRIERAMRTELSRTYAELTRTAGDTGATAGVIADHGERVANILVTNWTNIWSQFGRRILTGAMKHANPGMEFKRDIPLTPLFDEARQKWIQLFGSVKVTQITNTTKEQAEKIINQAIADAVAQGLSEADTAALLRERMREAGAQLSRLRSRVIARTESHNASTAATQAAAESSEIPMKREWVASMGERTRPDHRDASGQVVGMYEPFTVGGESLMYPGDPNGSAEQVINCFSGETKVSFDTLKKSIRSLYSGDMITIKTSRGHELTGTPNHPVMTDAGFIRLDQVDHSTNLICCDLGVNLTGSFYVNNMPSTFEQVHNSLAVVGVSVRDAGIPVNLYGRVTDGNVDIVRTKSLLRGAGVTKFLELCNKKQLSVASLGKGCFFSNGLLNGVGFMEFGRLVSDCFVGAGNLLYSFVRRNLGPLNKLSLRLTSDMDLVFFQNSSNHVSANSEMLCDLVLTGKLRDVHSLNFLNANTDALRPCNTKRANNLLDVTLTSSDTFSNFRATKSRFVHTDNIVSINRKFVHNHPVYTLETNEGLYNAGGVISSNCRCVVAYIPD